MKTKITRKILKRIIKQKMPLQEKFVHKEIPFFAQWESVELVKDIIERKIQARDDPKWTISGAAGPEEYELWSWNACGMACLKMILAASQKFDGKLIDLARTCEQYGGYRIQGNKIEGLYYHPFLEFIQTEFGLKGVVYPFMEIDDIVTELDNGRFVIASVSAKIRDPQSTPNKKGGHLVLVVGYDIPSQKLFIHNPSGFHDESQEYIALSFGDFERFFAQKGISVW